MTPPHSSRLTGRCTCGHTRYELAERPLFVHCCHCSWCQRETGSAFALNALIESCHVTLLAGQVVHSAWPSVSGSGQIACRCPNCQVVVWSYYGGAKEAVSFVRVGTLDDPDRCPPDIHIYTASKQAWVVLDASVPAVEAYYRRSQYWPADRIARYKAATQAV